MELKRLVIRLLDLLPCSAVIQRFRGSMPLRRDERSVVLLVELTDTDEFVDCFQNLVCQS